MNFSHFFIRRPIFAGVLSAVIFLVGLIAMWRLPISEYPEVVPPTIVVRASYPGANPKTIAETVASPLEQAINGVEDSLYMFSQATGDGVMTLTVTFKLGTDIDKAQVQVQNRVSQSLPKLPEEVRRLGVTTTKQSPDLTMVVHLFSPSRRYDEVYLRNYATLQVKDVLARIPGAGDVEVFGSGDYAMRLWLNPDKIAARNLTASDVVNAIREQNVQVAAGAIGQQPVGHPVDFELQINAKGRLISTEEFGQIIVKTGPNGEKTLLKDVARIELSAGSYSLRSLLNNKTAVALPIFQTPGANALQLSADVRRTMDELKKNFPDGVDYSVVYDPTVFVRHSIEAVVHTLLEATLLVVIVVIIFLQTWRASIIPLAAVPVSLVGTFAVMLALGFSINNLSLFGLVLAIGIVVDDAIVVVENVERNIALGLSPPDAAKRAMSEVTSPIIATALVLCAVFIPTAFISGLTGQFYKQFAITIAISTVISAFNSLTLSPALCAVLLKEHGAPKDGFARAMEKALGWFFHPFNRIFAWAGNKYSAGVGTVLRKSAVALIVYGGLVLLTGWSFNKVPTGFVPTQDKQYLVAFAQLPDGASLDRTEGVIRRMSDIGLKLPGVQSAVAFPGLSISGFSVAPNAGIVFFCLDPFEDRKTPNLSGPAIAAGLNKQFASIQDAFVLAVPPPPVMGLGTIGGFKLFVEDRADLGYDALYQNVQGIIGKSYQTPGLAGTFSTFTVNVPQLDADIDRVKAKQQGVPLQNLFETMQIYLGSLYVNDFNRFGRTYQVIAQADAPFRDHAEDITRLKTRNAKGQMVPLGTLVKVTETHGPDRAMRYNGYPAAEINGGPAPGFSSGQAEALIAKLASESLPKGAAFEWTELTYQRILAGNTAVYVYPLCLLLVFLVLAAQYESFRLPLAIILIVPMCLLFAITGVWLKGGDNNIFTQIGLIVLVGLACKNAILIVEFAKHKQDEGGLSPFQAAIEASRLRLRPILMTSIAFIAGVFPLVMARGAGAEMRQAMGIAVFAGMIGVTLFGLFLTPVFYVTLMKLGWKHAAAPAPKTQRRLARGRRRTGACMINHATDETHHEHNCKTSSYVRANQQTELVGATHPIVMNFVALKMLTGDKAKYLGLIFTIAFCTFLLQNQTSIFAGIMKRTGHQILDVTDAEIWVMDAKTEYFEQTKALKDTDLTRVRGVDGVQWAVKLFKGGPVVRTLAGKFAGSICLGLDDATLTGVPRKMLLGSWERLREPDSVVIDQAGYVLLFPDEPLQLDRTLELNDHKAVIVGISDASAPFLSWPVIHTRYSQAVNFVGRERTQLSYVLVRPQPGVDARELCRRIEAQTGLRARTSNQFRWDCVLYYLKNTGIPVNFGITIVIALIVGVVVAGQTFYLFTVENLKQFGALKAVGVTNWRLIGMILLQALSVGIVGFSLGTGIAAGFFEITLQKLATRGLVLMWQNVVLTGGCIFFVMILASILSLRRVLVLEPAIVFRG